MIGRLRPQLIGLARQLVAVATVNPPGSEYERFIDILTRQCRLRRLTTQRQVVPAGDAKALGVTQGSRRISLISRWPVKAAKTFHINAHYDVVPAHAADWRTAPFRPVVRQGKLFGRGTEDMKANIACTLIAVQALRQLGITPAVNLELSFTPDEETGSAAGVRYLMQHGLLRATYALGEGYEGDYVSLGNKGMLWLEVEAAGKAAHGSTPYQGVNALTMLLPVLASLHRLRERVEKRRTNYPVKDPRDSRASMVIGGSIRTGDNVNIVPDRAMVTIDRRVLPEETLARARAEIEAAVAECRNRQRRYFVRVLSSEEPVVSPPDAHYFGVFDQALRQVRGRPMKTALMTGGTDMRFFMRRGIPALGYSVEGKQRAHAANEFVYVRSLVETAQVIALVISGLGRE